MLAFSIDTDFKYDYSNCIPQELLILMEAEFRGEVCLKIKRFYFFLSSMQNFSRTLKVSCAGLDLIKVLCFASVSSVQSGSYLLPLGMSVYCNNSKTSSTLSI